MQQILHHGRSPRCSATVTGLTSPMAGSPWRRSAAEAWRADARFLLELVDAAARRRHSCSQNGDSIRLEVLVHIKLLLLAASVLATIGTATAVTAASPAAAAAGPCGTATAPHT